MRRQKHTPSFISTGFSFDVTSRTWGPKCETLLFAWPCQSQTKSNTLAYVILLVVNRVISWLAAQDCVGNSGSLQLDVVGLSSKPMRKNQVSSVKNAVVCLDRQQDIAARCVLRSIVRTPPRSSPKAPWFWQFDPGSCYQLLGMPSLAEEES